MIILGLTGSIGMGKTTIANMFIKHGIKVYSADEAVHCLYQEEKIVAKIEQEFQNVTTNNHIDRQKLAKYLLDNPENLKKLEKIIHPQVRLKQNNFIKQARENGEKLIILDIPLLFEVGLDKNVDKILVVTAPFAIQRERVLQRANMNEEKFKYILSKQLSDAQKRQKADYIIDTSKTLEQTQSDVTNLIKDLLQMA